MEDALKKAQEKEQQELNTLQLAIDNAETDEARAEAKKALADYERIDVTTLRDELTDQMWAEAQNKQWRNKAVSDTYYPGSVFKMSRLHGYESGVALKTPRTPAPVSGCLMIPPSIPSAVGTTPVTARKRWWTAFAIPATRT